MSKPTTERHAVHDKGETTSVQNDLSFLASIVSSSHDAIISKTLDGIITSWNPAAVKVFGYTAQEMIGQPITKLIPPHLQQEEKEIIDKIRQDQLVDHLETQRIRKDGEIIFVSLIISPIKDAQGTVIGASKIGRDITKRKKTEDQLAASERQFRDTLDNMLEGIQIHDFHWRYVYVNDALVKYSTYTREELIGHTLQEKYPGIEHSDVFKAMQHCMTARVPCQLDTEFSFPNGTKAYFELSIQPVPQGIFVHSIDITERKKAEDKIRMLNEDLERKVIERTAQLDYNILQLKESEEKFQKAFNASAAGISITRLSDSTYMDVNDTFLKMTGYSKEELIGHSSAELRMISDFKRRDEMLEAIKTTGRADSFEFTVRRKTGQHLVVLASVETIALKGERYGLNIIFDITDRKKAEEQLAIANQELESFSYSVSHDLRAPLRAINGNANILKEDYADKLDADGIKSLHTILRNSKRMGELIDDLLAFSRLGRKEVVLSDINMKDLVNSVMTELVTEDIQPRTQISLQALPIAKGDPSLIRQVWFNLIANAIKYSGNEPASILEIGANEKDNHVVYFIKDNGTGFDMKYYDKLFGVFQRLHSEREFEGTGIGLATVKRIINRHNGKVWAESKPNEGACFYFSLPG